MKKLGSMVWIIIFMSIYIGLQLTYSTILGFIFSIANVITGQEENLEEILEGFIGSQATGAIVLSGITAFLIYYIISKFRGKSFLKENRFEAISLKTSLKSVVMGISALAVSSIVMGIIAYFMDSAILQHMENMNIIMGGNIYIVFLAIAVVAPFIEEIIFRGLVYRELEKIMNIKVAVVVQGLLFGIYHFNITQGIYASILGIILGLLIMWTGSIWAPIIVHIVNNGTSFMLAQLGENQTAMVFAGGVVLVGIVLFPILMRSFYKDRVVDLKD